MKKLSPFLCLLLYFLQPCRAEGYTLSSLRYFPEKHSVGDPVRIIAVLRLEEGEQAEEPQSFPAHETLEIKSLTVDRRGDDTVVTIDLVSYAPGAATLPPISLGAVVLDSIPFSTDSLLDEEPFPVLKSHKPPGMLPGTRLLFLLITAGMSLVMLAAFPGASMLRKLTLAARLRRAALKPFRRLAGELACLRKLLPGMNTPDIYFGISKIIREYLSGRERINYMARTTAEIRRDLGAEKDAAPAGPRESFLRVLDFCDLVKYAGHIPAPGRVLEDLSGILASAAGFEQEKRAL